MTKRITIQLDGLLEQDVEALAAKLKIKTRSKLVRDLVVKGISAIRLEERTQTL